MGLDGNPTNSVVQHISLDRYDENGPTYYAVVVGEEVKTGYAETDMDALVAALKDAGIPVLASGKVEV